MRYAGGKGKCYQHIINVLPPHRVYIEPFLGGGAVLRNKRPAASSIGIDRDPCVIARWQRDYQGLAEFVCEDAIRFLSSYRFIGDELVYCDPPYLPNTRRQPRVYRYDYSEHDHRLFVEVVKSLPCKVVVSGYRSSLYDESFVQWTTRCFRAKTHRGLREEHLWFNFDLPDELHDPRFLGAGYRERQTMRRRFASLQSRITKLHVQEQFRVLDWLSAHLRGVQD